MAMQFKYRALVVDDDSGIRNVTTMVLQVNNYDVSSAENGIAAIPILKNTRPHVMISDLRMPDMNGYELLRMARQADRERVVGARDDGHELAAVVVAMRSSQSQFAAMHRR